MNMFAKIIITVTGFLKQTVYEIRNSYLIYHWLQKYMYSALTLIQRVNIVYFQAAVSVLPAQYDKTQSSSKTWNAPYCKIYA